MEQGFAKIKKCLFLLLFIACADKASANNVTTSNLCITGQNSSDETAQISFDISWENSWNDEYNCDAVWVFAKYKLSGSSVWEHVMLKPSGTNPPGYIRGSGTILDIIVPIDTNKSYGCFITRSDSGTGSVSSTGVELVWDWGDDGNSLSASDIIDELRLYAIEMVYVPEGSFWVGGVQCSDSRFNTEFFYNSTTSELYHVSSNNAITSGLSCRDNPPGIIPESYPKGYNAFYIMKYEITQGQWVDFFNTLSSTQKSNRDITDSTGKNSDNELYGNTVSWTTGDASAGNGQYRACNYLSWYDLCAYADWSGLRPISELEYEKAAYPFFFDFLVNGYNQFLYSWVFTSVSGYAPLTGVTSITNSGLINECAGNSGDGLCNAGGNTDKVMRVGFSATNSTTDKMQSATSHYGCQDLSGNVAELTAGVSDDSTNFRGTHGDGILTADGYANNDDWPCYDEVDTFSVSAALKNDYEVVSRGGYFDNSVLSGSGPKPLSKGCRLPYTTLIDQTQGGRLGRSMITN